MKVIAVNKNAHHGFHKSAVNEINLIEGIGVEGDAHAGEYVKHRSRVRKDPKQPNLRQVHLIHVELFEELKTKGFNVNPGEIGENITTSGIKLLELPENTILKIGKEAQLRITGLRNPCHQLDDFQKGLMKAVLDQDEQGNLIRKAGVMSVVIKSGIIKAGDEIQVIYPSKPFAVLKKV